MSESQTIEKINDAEEQAQGLQLQIQKALLSAFDFVIQGHKEKYINDPSSMPNENKVRSIVSGYANVNAALAGGFNLIPGPWGMAALIPEITSILRNQICMVYEIAIAYGWSVSLLDKAILTGLFSTAAGSSVVGLATIKGGKVLIRRPALQVMQKVVAMLAGKITQKVIKAAVSKWLPIVGAAAMAIWARVETEKMGKKLIEYLKELKGKKSDFGEPDIIEAECNNACIEDIELEKRLDEEEAEIEEEIKEEIELAVVEKNHIPIESLPCDATTEHVKALAEKQHKVRFEGLKCLMNLMKIDGKVDDSEVELLQSIIEKSELDSNSETFLISKIATEGMLDIDYSVIKEDPEQALWLMINLVAMAKADNVFHITEKMYLKQVGKKLDMSEDDIKEIMA